MSVVKTRQLPVPQPYVSEQDFDNTIQHIVSPFRININWETDYDYPPMYEGTYTGRNDKPAKYRKNTPFVFVDRDNGLLIGDDFYADFTARVHNGGEIVKGESAIKLDFSAKHLVIHTSLPDFWAVEQAQECQENDWPWAEVTDADWFDEHGNPCTEDEARTVKFTIGGGRIMARDLSRGSGAEYKFFVLSGDDFPSFNDESLADCRKAVQDEITKWGIDPTLPDAWAVAAVYACQTYKRAEAFHKGEWSYAYPVVKVWAENEARLLANVRGMAIESDSDESVYTESEVDAIHEAFDIVYNTLKDNLKMSSDLCAETIKAAMDTVPSVAYTMSASMAAIRGAVDGMMHGTREAIFERRKSIIGR